MSAFDNYVYDQEQKQQQQQPRKKSRMALLLLGSRVMTLVALGISIVILRNSTKTYDDKVEYGGKTYDGYTIRYSNYASYEYMLIIMVVGCVYNLLQIPIATYYFFRQKLLINHRGFVLFQFFSDQVILILLATAVGAAFGATVDLDKGVRNKEDYENNLHRFWRLIYLPATFFLIGFVSSVISSVITSMTFLAKISM